MDDDDFEIEELPFDDERFQDVLDTGFNNCDEEELAWWLAANEYHRYDEGRTPEAYVRFHDAVLADLGRRQAEMERKADNSRWLRRQLDALELD